MLATSLRVALRSLRAQRLRTALAMLGIVIGVAALVIMIAVGSGARDRIAAQIRSLGANLISINPGSATMSSVRLGSGAAPALSEDDAFAIEAEVQGVLAVAPILYSRAQFAVGSSNWSGNIRGVTSQFFMAREWGVADGREITPEDNSRAAKIVLLGVTMRHKLFGDADPVGAAVRIRNVPFTVVGVLDRKGQSAWGDDQDDVALMPLTTARLHFVGMNRASPRFVHNITVKFAEGISAEETMLAIGALLRQRHRLQDDKENTFLISNLAEAADVEQAATRVLSLLLTAIASVSLVVGGIGIMNIMLVSVTERTREIGIRLAVGARERDILAQFLIEAVMLTALGGGVGALAGIAGSLAIATHAGWPVVIDLGTVILAVCFAAAIGVFFGLYPARQAARLDPIVSLRYE